MDDRILRALAEDLTVDITTIGARTGQPRRLEIWMLHIDGRYFITGTPGPRDWLRSYFNLMLLREHRSGGHFAHAEEPETLVADLRDTFRPLRARP